MKSMLGPNGSHPPLIIPAWLLRLRHAILLNLVSAQPPPFPCRLAPALLTGLLLLLPILERPNKTRPRRSSFAVLVLALILLLSPLLLVLLLPRHPPAAAAAAQRRVLLVVVAGRRRRRAPLRDVIRRREHATPVSDRLLVIAVVVAVAVVVVVILVVLPILVDHHGRRCFLLLPVGRRGEVHRGRLRGGLDPRAAAPDPAGEGRLGPRAARRLLLLVGLRRLGLVLAHGGLGREVERFHPACARGLLFEWTMIDGSGLVKVEK
ncbi:hypothetical protein GGR56DRAFT_186244 [Xylariaceae sp. FL0804]|nr:hypothetical protein GGR56DRAFT_186244 [Xylariaceae sp. FL0804]